MGCFEGGGRGRQCRCHCAHRGIVGCFEGGGRVSARRARHFSLLRQRKVPKRKATLLSASLRCAPGNLGCSEAGCAVELALRCARRSNSHGESVHEAWVCPSAHPRHPASCAPQAHTEGKQPNSHTGHRCARPGVRGAQRLRVAGRAQRWPVLGSPLLAAPAAGRLRGGMRVGARMLRCLTRRICPNEARQRVVSYAAHPASAPTQVCPAGVADCRVALSLLTFFRRSERK